MTSNVRAKRIETLEAVQKGWLSSSWLYKQGTNR